METTEAVDEDESCRSSVISDLDELEAHLYSCVHHEGNSCFDKEYSAVINLSSVERIGYQNISVGENEEEKSCNFSGGSFNSSEENEDLIRNCVDKQLSEFSYSACIVSRSSCDVNTPLQPSGNISLIASARKKSNAPSVQSKENQCSSPLLLDISSSEDLEHVNKSLPKRQLITSSTPVKEVVVLDDSGDDVQIEYEKFPIKSKKKKKRKKDEIKEDIRLNTRSSTEVICLDVDEDLTFSERENFDSLLCGPGYENSEYESSLCKTWTPQMIQFYDEPWGGEWINVSDHQKTMSDDGWKLDLSDQFAYLATKNISRRYFGAAAKMWCNRCNQKGHLRKNCTEKISPPRCFRCGGMHQEYSCNQKICLTCGRNRSSLIPACQQCQKLSRKKCYICQQPGHPPGCCPDLWRRFHATVAPGEIVTPAKVLYKDSKNIYCCNCASRGHHVFQCKKNTFSSYIPISPKVTSYVDPEILLMSQNTCSNTSTNWESVGAIPPEYYCEDWEKHSYLERGVKRPKYSGKQPKTKYRKLNDNVTSELVNTKVSSSKNSKSSDKLLKKNKTKTVKLKVKKKINSQKKTCQKDKVLRVVDNVKPQMPKVTLNEGKKQGDSSTSKGPETKPEVKGREVTRCNDNTSSVERVIVLSPGHLKRIESDEGKEILNYVTSKFHGVSAKVVNNPSGILRLMGTGSDIDQVKATLFDVLNNKCRLDQLKKPTKTIRNDLRVTIHNSDAHPALVGIKMKSKNKKQQKNIQEKMLKNPGSNGTADARMKIINDKKEIKKKNLASSMVKGLLNNGNVNKSSHQGKKRNWQSVVYNKSADHTKEIHNPVNNNSSSVRHVGSGRSSITQVQRENDYEIRHDIQLGIEDVNWVCMDRPGPSQQNAKFRVNRLRCKKRKKNKANNKLTASMRNGVMNERDLLLGSAACDSVKNFPNLNFQPVTIVKKKRVTKVKKNNDHSNISDKLQFSKYN